MEMSTAELGSHETLALLIKNLCVEELESTSFPELIFDCRLMLVHKRPELRADNEAEHYGGELLEL